MVWNRVPVDGDSSVSILSIFQQPRDLIAGFMKNHLHLTIKNDFSHRLMDALVGLENMIISRFRIGKFTI